MQYVLADAKCGSFEFEGVRNKLDVLQSQVFLQAQLESANSRALQDVLQSMKTDKGLYICVAIRKTWL